MPLPSPLFGALLIVSGAALALWTHRIIRRYRIAQDWPKVPAVMLKSELKVSTDGDGTSYVPQFLYSYSVDGVEYRSSVHSEGRPLRHDPEQASRELIEKYPVGTIVQVAVDRDHPASAVLDTGFPEFWVAVRRVGVGLVVAGALILVYAAM